MQVASANVYTHHVTRQLTCCKYLNSFKAKITITGEREREEGVDQGNHIHDHLELEHHVRNEATIFMM